ncbi:MAG: hypothetical protein E3J35_01810 [Methanomassiliicoccales archaeon]|nr:MAG: hypothetical protein E3J35_01810 [Methanomassiliicoccales archaeon]
MRPTMVSHFVIEIVNIRDDKEEEFWLRINKNPLNHRYFIMDWKYQKQDSDIFLALEEGGDQELRTKDSNLQSTTSQWLDIERNSFKSRRHVSLNN